MALNYGLAMLLAAATVPIGPANGARDLVQDGAPAPPPANAAPPPNVDTVAASEDRHQRLTVPVTIDGVGPFNFLIDTGAQATVLTGDLAARLKLAPSGSARLVAMGSSAIVQTVELDGLEFADRIFNGITAPLLQSKDIGADGILGLDSLQDLRVLIDFDANSIAVADASDLGGNNGYEIIVRAHRQLGRMVITNARVEGVRTAVIIDTGAQNSTGNPALLRELRAKREDKLVSIDVNGVELESDLAYARKLEIGGMELHRVPIGFAASPVFVELGLADQPTLILGMRNLSVLDRVAIDFSSQRVLFDLPSGAIRQNLHRKTFFRGQIG